MQERGQKKGHSAPPCQPKPAHDGKRVGESAGMYGVERAIEPLDIGPHIRTDRVARCHQALPSLDGNERECFEDPSPRGEGDGTIPLDPRRSRRARIFNTISLSRMVPRSRSLPQLLKLNRSACPDADVVSPLAQEIAQPCGIALRPAQGGWVAVNELGDMQPIFHRGPTRQVSQRGDFRSAWNRVT